jgi:putative ABC transport system permease protein
VGDTVRLPSEAGVLEVPVLAVFRDYGSELGTIMLARSAYDRNWTDPDVTSLGIFLERGPIPRTWRRGSGPPGVPPPRW